MRRLSLFLFLFLLISCAGKKNLIKTSVAENVTVNDSVSVKSFKDISNESTALVDSTSESTETIIRRFDTSIPPDSFGRCPIKEEIIHRSKKQTYSGIKHRQENAVIFADSTSRKDSSDLSLNNSVVSETKTSVAGGNWIIILWVGTALLTAVALYFFVIRKFTRWLK